MSNPQIRVQPRRVMLNTSQPDQAQVAIRPNQTDLKVEQAVAVIAQVGKQGPAGPPGSGGGSASRVAFAFGDASPLPLLTLAANTTVFTAQIVIQTPFNGAGASLRLGDDEQSDRLLISEQNDPTQAAEYEANPGYTYASATTVLLTITPGSGCTQGAGYVLLEI